MLKRIGIVSGFLLMCGLVFAATAKDKSISVDLSGEEAIVFNKTLQDKLDAFVAPLNTYHEQLMQVKEPSYETLLPVLHQLAEYNKIFAEGTDKNVLRSLASKIASPAKTGWNSYRKVGFNEIFAEYTPDNQNDKDVALLEYNVKLNNVPQKDLDNIQLLNESKSLGAFMDKFNYFVYDMNAAYTYRPNDIIRALLPIARSYEGVLHHQPALARLIKESVFTHPVAFGFGRTYTIEELQDKLGRTHTSESAPVKTVKELRDTYKGLQPEEAEVFAAFVASFGK